MRGITAGICVILGLGLSAAGVAGVGEAGVEPGEPPAAAREFVAPASPTPQQLAAGFRNPPAVARPMAYWGWMDGCIRPDYFPRELRAYRDAGVSGLYIFDVGAKDPDNVIPAGPEFVGPQSLDAMVRAIEEAGKLDMDMGIIVSSSWNAGGPWVQPEHAAMGLFRAVVDVTGPRRYEAELPFPSLPKSTPRRPDGQPAFFTNVAVLAIPEQQRLPGHEFVFKLPGESHTVDRAVLVNTQADAEQQDNGENHFARDFVVLLSTTGTQPDDFAAAVRGELAAHTRPQQFKFAPTKARFVKLVILSGHNPESDRIQLGEFELYSTDGQNVVCAYHPEGSRTGAELLSCSSALGTENDAAWTAANIHDRAKAGANGSWSSAGAPPLIIPDQDRIIDLTDRLDAAGNLTWDVPAGKWQIIRLVCANTGQRLAIPSPNSQGLAIDHFNPAATAMHFRTVLGRLQDRIGPFQDTALKIAYVCSYELRGAAWTPQMLDEFRRRRGYNMTRWLPALFGSVIQSPEYTAQFRYDYRRTLGELLVDAFYRRGREICHEYGLLLCAEAGGPGPPLHQVPVDALLAQGAVDIPRGEFWHSHNVWVVKETACAAHIYGKRIVDMEAFTSWRHWQDGPYDLKPLADRAMCGGTNHFTFHTGSHSPPEAGLPGWVYHAGTHMNPNLVWWPKARPFIDYLGRSSFLLQQGVPVGDVCYYYGRQGFNFVPPKSVDPSLGFGYDYDVTNADVLLHRMQVRDGRIVLPEGTSYEILVLPDRDTIDWEVLQQLEKLVRAGATVVGRKPTRSVGLTEYELRDRQVRELADRLWGPCDGKTVLEHTYGQGRIVWGRPLRDVLAARGIGPDFQFASAAEDTELDYIHRQVGDVHVYFVSNKQDRWVDADCTFRVAGRAPELWMPDTGEMQPQPVYSTAAETTTVPLRLAPHGSLFVVFRAGPPRRHWTAVKYAGKDDDTGGGRAAAALQVAPDGNVHLIAGAAGRHTLVANDGQQQEVRVPAVPAAAKVTGPWQVTFAEDRVSPSQAEFKELISWTEHSRDDIRFYSGIARYETTFDAPSSLCADDVDLALDLGHVRFVADVWLNGQHLGILWKPPFRVNASKAIRAGENRLVVEVANTWSNRLAGDARLPDQKPYCRTNMKNALTWEVPWKEAPLLDSGLMGPVRLLPARKVAVSD